MDLSEFDIVQAATVEVRNPETLEPLKGEDGIVITLQIAGVDSDVFHQRQYALAEARAKLTERPSGETIDSDRHDTLAACLVGWSGITLDGQPLPHSPGNALALVKRLPWLADQVDRAIVNRALHFKKAQPGGAVAPTPAPSKAKGSRRAAA